MRPLRSRAWHQLTAYLDADTAGGRDRVAALLMLAVVLVTGVGVGYGVSVMPLPALVLPLVLAGLLLNPARVQLLVALTAAGTLAYVIGDGVYQVRPVSIVVVAAVALIAYVLAVDRQRLGLTLGRGDTMLIELRDNLERQGDPPPLPPGWAAEVARRPAGGGSFGGDFLVAARTGDGTVLELALVDVSGKGLDAGTRALLLSGALGGLLGAVAPEHFLPAANDYLLRQEWNEGFATCVHVAVDLTDGEFRLSNAGHPPPALFAGGSGRWELLDRPGTALGLLPTASFGELTGRIGPNDALLLYTDGLIEVPGRDLELGIDRLLGVTERIIGRGFAGGAETIIEASVQPGVSDDRAVVLLWRSG